MDVHTGVRKNTFIKESFTDNSGLIVEVESIFWLMPEHVFESRFGAKPKDLGVGLDIVKNEWGTEDRGVLIQDDGAPHPGWKRVTFKRVSGTNLSKFIVHAEDQLRASQGQDVGQWYEADLCKSRPPGCRPGLCEADLALLVEKKKKEKADRTAMTEAVAELDVPTSLANAEKQKDDSDEAEDSDGEIYRVSLPSGKAKAKSKGRGRPPSSPAAKPASKKRAASATSAGSSTEPPTKKRLSSKTSPHKAAAASVRADDAQSVAGSALSSSTKKTRTNPSPASKANEVEKYQGLLDLAQIMSGANLGHHYNNAKRKLQSWVEGHDESQSAEYISLASHVQCTEKAMKVTPSTMSSLSVAELDQILEELMPMVDEEALSGSFFCAVLMAKLDPHVKGAEDIARLLDSLWPVQSGCEGNA